MILQYVSDLHLEFPENKDFLYRNPIKALGDVLLLAGDIVPFAVMDKHNDFFSYISDHFNITFWIPGNHEYYYFDIADKCGTLYEEIKSNVFLVNNKAVIHENVNFIFSTLWSKIWATNQRQIENSLSDFQVIRYKENRFSPHVYNELHNESIDFLNQELHLDNNCKKIVATHHVPTFLNYPEKYKGDTLNQAFAVELFDLIETMGPEFWIFGHHHCNIPDFKIGKTHLRTNQLGYVKYNEHIEYHNGKIIKL